MTAPDRRALARTLHSAALKLLRRLRASDEELGLSPARASALSILVFGGPRTPSELADAERVARPTITKLVQGMQRDGLVRLEPHREDRRAVRLVATARGRKLLERGRERRLDALEELLASRTAEERALLARAADVLAELAGSHERVAGAPSRAARGTSR